MESAKVLDLDSSNPRLPTVQEHLTATQKVKAQEKKKEIPPVSRTKKFTIDHQSRFLGHVQGEFETTVLTPRLSIMVGANRSRLLAGGLSSHIDPSTVHLAEEIAHLSVCLTKKPDWFDPETCEDREILSLVYTEVASHEAAFWQPQESGSGQEGDSEG